MVAGMRTGWGRHHCSALLCHRHSSKATAVQSTAVTSFAETSLCCMPVGTRTSASTFRILCLHSFGGLLQSKSALHATPVGTRISASTFRILCLHSFGGLLQSKSALHATPVGTRTSASTFRILCLHSFWRPFTN